MMKRLIVALCGGLCIWALLPASGFAMPTPPDSRAAAAAPHAGVHVLRAHPLAANGKGTPTGNVMGSGDLVYYGGPVLHDPVAYVVFWGGYWNNGSGGVVQDGQIVLNYLNDMGATSYENTLIQYHDTHRDIGNNNRVAGWWNDTSTPPTDTSCHSGPTIHNSAIVNEVNTAIAARGWPKDGTNAIYFVLTPPGDYVNNDFGQCSITSFCAYHSYTSSLGNGVAYAALVYPASGFGYTCIVSNSPNGDLNGESLANFASHEQLESITDPFPDGPGATGLTGWTDSANYEIGDKCAWDFSDGDTHLNNGGTFYIQTEYSNFTHSCVNGFWAPMGVGVFRPSTAVFYLSNSAVTGKSDIAVAFGAPNDKPVVGDWTGKGYDSIGVFRNGVFFLRNSNTTGAPNLTVYFGTTGDIPVVGDWTGKGYDSIGIYRPSTQTFYLRNSNTSGGPDISVTFGAPGDIPVVGDWDHNGTTTIGVYRPSTGAFFLRNSNASGAPDIILTFGGSNWQPLSGDWNDKGYDSIGVYNPTNGTFYLRNSNTSGYADIVTPFAAGSDLPLTGRWNR